MDVLEALDNFRASAKGELFFYLKIFICFVVKRLQYIFKILKFTEIAINKGKQSIL